MFEILSVYENHIPRVRIRASVNQLPLSPILLFDKLNFSLEEPETSK